MQLTVTISDDAGARINHMVRLGGSPQLYIRKWIEDISSLPQDQQEELREILDTKVKRHAEAQAADARKPAAPAVPTGIQPRAKRQLHEVR